MRRFGRRELLGGAALAGAAALGCGQKKDPYRIDKPPVPHAPGWRAGEERWVLSTCALCEAGCGIKVRVVEGRAVKIEGNPEHPVNRGGLCSRGQAALQALYHPDRVRSPLRRVGARGEGKWKSISWDEAIGEVVAKLGNLRTAGHPERLVLIDGETGTLTRDLWARFLSVYGSPNHIGLGSARAAGIKLATLYTQGRYGLPAYDLARLASGCVVLAMGTDLLESSGQAMQFLSWGSLDRPHVICVSPRRPGCRFDEWIPIAPGGYGALALSLAHVLVREGLVDSDFLRDSVSGFFAWRDQDGVEQPGFEALVRACAPEQTQEVTGIAAATVQRLAHALAKQRPSRIPESSVRWPTHKQRRAVAASDGSATAASNGLATGMAIATLNALLASLKGCGVPGAHEYAVPHWEVPAVDAVAATASAAPRIDGAGTAACPLGRSRVQAVPEAIAQAKPYPVEAMFLHGTCPLGALPGRQAWVAALAQVPFLVRFTSWLDESAGQADLVLPESLPLETLDVVQPATDSGESLLSLRQPVVAPLSGTRQVGDVIVALAAGLGGSVGRSLPWKSYSEAVAKALLAETWDDVKKKGGQWNESETDRPVNLPRRFEIGSKAIVARMAGFPDAAKAAQAWPCQGLPPWEPPRFSGDPRQFPLQLVPYRPVQFVENGGRFLPWLSELPLVSGNPWPLRAEINPADAAQLGLADGDQVLVESPVGSCRAVAQLSDGVRVGVVAMALGKAGVIDLVVPDEDQLSGVLAWQGTRVRVRKVS
jgi:menaquinone reductase, molybdopterin-binding-like subunit